MKKRSGVYGSNTDNHNVLSLTSFRSLILLTLFLLLLFPFVSAQLNSTEETAKVNKAYSCLQNKTSGNCDSLSIEEKTFSVLATGQCRSELVSSSQNSGECWAGSSSQNCNVKPTAQAMLALKTSSTSAENWLDSKKITPSDLTWYLEIESDSATTCSISYGSSSYTISIDENKKINNNAGSCLFPAQDDYWLEVSPSCYNTEFTVSCDKDFLTTTLFRKNEVSSTIHVSDETSSASAGGATREQVDSYCFADSGTCNYEATLWAALALDSQDKSVSAYLPYLITLADDNNRYIPDSFLYLLTGKTDHKISLFSKQKSSQYWQESGDRYYDTALALYPLLDETSQEKTNSKEWLLDSQGDNGCWENNVRNTGFILASVWPKATGGTGTGGGTSLPDCGTSGFYCASSSIACTVNAGGSVLSEYDCPGVSQKCCSVQPIVRTCAEQGGEICASSERCIGGTEITASDTRSTEICCANSGSCSSSIDDDEEEPPTTLPPRDNGGSSLWIWILLILIVLVVIGIIFRNKLRMFWFKIKHRGGHKPGGPGHPTSRPPPGFFPRSMQRPIQRIERRILLPSQAQHRPSPAQARPTTAAKMKSGAQKELDDVLKKLKEMGK